MYHLWTFKRPVHASLSGGHLVAAKRAAKKQVPSKIPGTERRALLSYLVRLFNKSLSLALAL